jgi:hypothetical protein
MLNILLLKFEKMLTVAENFYHIVIKIGEYLPFSTLFWFVTFLLATFCRLLFFFFLLCTLLPTVMVNGHELRPVLLFFFKILHIYTPQEERAHYKKNSGCE